MKSRHVESPFISTHHTKSGRSESNRLLRVPKTRGRPVSLTPMNEWRDESPESRVESPNCFRSLPAGTRLSTLRSQLVSDPCGIRTQPNQRERLTTSPEVERAGVAGLWPSKHGLNKWKLFAACSVSQAGHKKSSNCQREPTVGREVLEPSSPSLQLGATPSQLPARRL